MKRSKKKKERKNRKISEEIEHYCGAKIFHQI